MGCGPAGGPLAFDPFLQPGFGTPMAYPPPPPQPRQPTRPQQAAQPPRQQPKATQPKPHAIPEPGIARVVEVPSPDRLGIRLDESVVVPEPEKLGIRLTE